MDLQVPLPYTQSSTGGNHRLDYGGSDDQHSSWLEIRGGHILAADLVLAHTVRRYHCYVVCDRRVTMTTVSIGKGLLGIVVFLVCCGLLLGWTSADTDLLNHQTREAEAEQMQVETERQREINSIDVEQYRVLKEAETQAQIIERTAAHDHQEALRRLEFEREQRRAIAFENLMEIIIRVGVPTLCLSLLIVVFAVSQRFFQTKTATMAEKPKPAAHQKKETSPSQSVGLTQSSMQQVGLRRN